MIQRLWVLVFVQNLLWCTDCESHCVHTVWARYRDCGSWYLYTIQYDAQTVNLIVCTRLRMMQAQYQHTVNHDAQTVSLTISTLSSMMHSQCIHIVEHGAQTKVLLFACSWTLCTNQVQFIYLFIFWNNGGTLTDIEAGAVTELCHCDLHNKFIHEHFKLKSYSHLTHSSLLPVCTIQAFFIKQGFSLCM